LLLNILGKGWTVSIETFWPEMINFSPSNPWDTLLCYENQGVKRARKEKLKLNRVQNFDSPFSPNSFSIKLEFLLCGWHVR
jgi:hypothetical protein